MATETAFPVISRKQRPAGVGRALWKKFWEDFGDGCEMWTSEDGTLLSIAIIPHEEWQESLQFNQRHRFKDEAFDLSRAQLRFAYREWAGSEFFDGPYSQRRGKVWRLQETPTDLPVVDYQLIYPR